VRAAEQYGAHPHVTTRPVLLEIGNALAGVGHRAVAASYLETIEQESSTEIVPLSDVLFRRGFALYRERPDKTWGLTDCISFVAVLMSCSANPLRRLCVWKKAES
jgi:predicted nucleic acid-binding protein